MIQSSRHYQTRGRAALQTVMRREDALSLDVMVVCLSFCSVGDISSATRVSRIWNQDCSEPRLWKLLGQRDLGTINTLKQAYTLEFTIRNNWTAEKKGFSPKVTAVTLPVTPLKGPKNILVWPSSDCIFILTQNLLVVEVKLSTYEVISVFGNSR
jgi:hypothetical protein